MNNKILQTIENSLLISSKVCARCKQEKDLNDFRKAKSGTFGRSCYCKLCQNAVNKDLYWLNKEKRLEKIKKWNADHPDAVAFYKNEHKKRKKNNKKEN